MPTLNRSQEGEKPLLTVLRKAPNAARKPFMRYVLAKAESWSVLKCCGRKADRQPGAGSTVADMEPLQRGISGSGPKAWI